jgi:hypothetical protein
MTFNTHHPYNTLVMVAVLLLLALACGKDELSAEKEEDKGEHPSIEGPVLVSVFENETRVANGITVITFPNTSTHTTNDMGEVALNLPDGNYDILAYIENYGSGKATISVNDGLSQNIRVDLVPEKYIEPAVKIQSPESEAGFSENEAIVFEGSISDQYSSSSEIEFQWLSDIDGKFQNAELNSDGLTTETTSPPHASSSPHRNQRQYPPKRQGRHERPRPPL